MITIKDATNGVFGDKVSNILDYAAAKLGIAGAEVVVQVNDAVLDKFSNGQIEYQALLYPAIPHKYNLILRSKLEDGLLTTLCHEAIHLQQYEDGYLTFNVKSGSCTWKGQAYAANYPYFSRPWEREAFSRQGKLEKGYMKKGFRCL